MLIKVLLKNQAFQPQLTTTVIEEGSPNITIPLSSEEVEEKAFEELDEEVFNVLDEFVSSITFDSEVSKYHEFLQKKLRYLEQ